MSATAPARSAPARAGGRRPAPARAPRPRLFVVPPIATSSPRAPFVVLVAALLVSGLAALLFLHTALAEDSFRLHDLQVRSEVLDDQEQALEQSIARSAAPRSLAARARALGMVQAENPAFIRLSDGRILGKPKAGVAPPPPAPTASASPSDGATPDPKASGKATPTAANDRAGRHRDRVPGKRGGGATPAAKPSPGTSR